MVCDSRIHHTLNLPTDCPVSTTFLPPITSGSSLVVALVALVAPNTFPYVATADAGGTLSESCARAIGRVRLTRPFVRSLYSDAPGSPLRQP